MSSFNFDQAAASIDRDALSRFDDSVTRQAAASSSLASIFRGKFGNLILPNRKATQKA
jgi:hypothetical protein